MVWSILSQAAPPRAALALVGIQAGLGTRSRFDSGQGSVVKRSTPTQQRRCRTHEHEENNKPLNSD